jgi:hypothetical protein
MERIQAYLNPWDFLLWVSEEIDGHDWDQMEKNWGFPIGVGLNMIFLIARANSRSGGGKAFDDVFGEDEGVPWLSWLVRGLLLQSSCAVKLTVIGIIHRQPPSAPSWDFYRSQMQSTHSLA